jgi:predicted transcriptional regulator
MSGATHRRTVTDSETRDVADVLAKRHDVLRALVEEPRPKRDLVEALDVPRSTLDRAVRELERVGLVECSGGTPEPTAFGRRACRTRTSYLSELRGLRRGADVISSLPADSPVDETVLRGADVARPSEATPDSAVGALLRSVRGADSRVRGVAPAALTGHASAFVERATEGDTELELLLSEEVLDAVRRSDRIEEVGGRSDVAVQRGPIPVSFGLWLVDDSEVGVVVYTDSGVGGVIVNDTERAVAWGEDLYSRVRENCAPAVTA